jgi:phosphoglycolate phosphatase-like HAD superfamily hydrolase
MERKSSVRTPKKYDSFVFDLDGTLFSIPVDWASVRKRVEDISGEALAPAPLFLQIREMVGRRPELRALLFPVIDSFELKASDGTKPEGGSLDFLRRISEGRRKAGLVTMQGDALYDKICDRFGLKKYFAVCVTRNNSLDRTEQLLIALRSMAATPQVTLFIGDTANDQVCGRRIGVDVAIRRRTRTTELRGGGSSGPDYSFFDFSELDFLTM